MATLAPSDLSQAARVAVTQPKQPHTPTSASQALQSQCDCFDRSRFDASRHVHSNLIAGFRCYGIFPMRSSHSSRLAVDDVSSGVLLTQLACLSGR